jgi:hypothetical protein
MRSSTSRAAIHQSKYRHEGATADRLNNLRTSGSNKRRPLVASFVERIVVP